MERITACMQPAITTGVFPGAVLLAAQGTQQFYFKSFGVADLYARQPMTCGTVFDLASLTKPLATTLVIMLLVQSGELALDQPIRRILRPLRHARSGEATIRHLLLHTSGLPAWRPYFKALRAVPGAGRLAALRRLLLAEEPLHPAGAVCSYSDIGFMLLEWITHLISGMRLDRLVEQRFYHPWKITPLFFRDLRQPLPPLDVAATEDCPWRERLLKGEVHDDNAWAAGGIQGHAGLFGNAAAVDALLSRIWMLYHGAEGPLSAFWVRRMLTRDPLSARALGFDTPAPQGSSSGRFFPSGSIGHLGFSGTSFWMDPVTGRRIILLTNRIHPHRDNSLIKQFRPLIHDVVMQACGWNDCDQSVT